MGKMLFNCGLISRSDVVETSGLQLTGEYIGSTKKVVSDHGGSGNEGNSEGYVVEHQRDPGQGSKANDYVRADTGLVV